MHFFLFIIILIIFISQDILLFNEESLILLCFIGFCWIFLDNLGNSISLYFYKQSEKVQNDFLTSYNDLLKTFKSKLDINFKKSKLYIYFFNIKTYYKNFNLNIINKLNHLQVTKKQIVFKNKLVFIYNLEQQFLKLITLLILTKIKKLVLLNLFYKNDLKISNFVCINKICLLEYLKTI